MKKLHFSAKSIPAFLAVLTVVAYGLLIPWLGFYWDDWAFAWIARTFGPAEFLPAFSGVRPLLGPIFMVTTALLPESPLAWQLFGLLVRFTAGFATWWALGKVWPEHKRQVLFASLLFLVFPGYGQQWVALTHINQEWIPLIAILFSFGLTALALRDRKHFVPLTVAAVVLGAFGLASTEYFIGYEFLRLLLIWFMFPGEKFRGRAWTVLKAWLPYLLVWAANAAWLFFFYRSDAYVNYTMGGMTLFQQSPLQIALTLQQEFLNTFTLSGFTAWTQTFAIFSQPLKSATFWLAGGLAILSFAGLLVYLLKLDLPDEDPPAGESWARQALLFGFAGIFLGRLPSFVAGLPLALTYDWDRFMISIMLGAALFSVGLIEFLVKSDRRKTVLVGLLLAVAVGYQFQAANSFRRDWNRTQDFFWQLSWRAPGLEEGTVLLTAHPPLQYQSDLQMTAPLNWVYAADNSSHDLSYALLSSESRLGSEMLPGLQPDLPIVVDLRTARLETSTNNVVVFFFPSEGCLRILDPVYTDPADFPQLPERLLWDISLSNPELILPEATPPTLPGQFFGAEPAHGWCYYYTKAELARQAGDWSGVVELDQQAAVQGLSPLDPFEWLPFVEGDAMTGDIAAAADRTLSLSADFPDTIPALCSLWERVRARTGTPVQVEEILNELDCQP